MNCDLTPRQLEFLRGLHDLVLAWQAPVHYSEVATSLGVSRYSAYDMLKLLEMKGLVAAEYVLSSTKDGPGRSRIVFRPTRSGLQLLGQQAPGGSMSAVAPEEWTAFKNGILRRLGEAQRSSNWELLAELIARLPERRRPLHYCAQMVSVLVLNLRRAQDKMAAINPFDALDALTTHQDEDLSALAGLSLGSVLVADDRTDPSVIRQLIGHIQSFQDELDSLSGESKSRLRAFLHEAIHILQTSAAATAPLPASQDPPRRA
jgi:DNA-binding PadR family transcriptional regulator